MVFKTKSGMPIAEGFTRLVIGARGAYLEFTKDMLIEAHLHMPWGQAWRIEPYWKKRIYYYEYRTNQDYVKIYYQLKTVGYADYKIGMLYISPNDLYI